MDSSACTEPRGHGAACVVVPVRQRQCGGQSSRGQVCSRSEPRHSRLAAPRRGGLWSRDCQAVVRLRPWRARAARNALRRTRPPTRAQPAFASALYAGRAPPLRGGRGEAGQERAEPRWWSEGRCGFRVQQQRRDAPPRRDAPRYPADAIGLARNRCPATRRLETTPRCPTCAINGAPLHSHAPSFALPSTPLHALSSLLRGDQCLSPSHPSGYGVPVKALSVGLSTDAFWAVL